MCGIAGIVHRDPARPIDTRALDTSMTVIAHRGPDDHGTFVAPGVGLASRRLSIVDLSPRGHMPMQTPDGRFVAVYNGEIYNFRALREELVAAGLTFVSDTDTEVLLRLYEIHGADMLGKLNGMFGVAIWDTAERSLFIARDRLGVKPVYYAETAGSLRFGSEEKSLLALGADATFDADVMSELLCFRFTAGTRTPFGAIKRLLPGHYLRWRDGQTDVRRWWNLADRAAALGCGAPGEAARWFADTFDDAVELRRIADVPVGVLLSGGLDSTSVAASLARRDAGRLASFTVRFAEDGYDEGPAARTLAGQFGLAHHELEVRASDLGTLLDRASWLSDEPIAHASDLHLLAISRHAKQHVTVLLSGEGADETLGGYARYTPLRFPGALSAARAGAGAMLRFGATGRARKLARLLSEPVDEAVVALNACDVLPSDLAVIGLTPGFDMSYRESVLAEARRIYPRERFRQALYLDLHTYLVSLLHRNDRMTMGASIECRVPFLDYRLVEGVAALPTASLLCGRESKPLLRRALGHRLPAHILNRRKWGFGVPWHQYLRREPGLRARVESLGHDESLAAAGCDMRAVAALVGRFLAGDPRADALVLQLFLVASWRRSYFEQISATLRTAGLHDTVAAEVSSTLDDAPVPRVAMAPPHATARPVPVLLVGNFLSATKGSRGVCEDLAIRLPDAGCPVVTTSTRPARLPRLVDMVSTVLSQRHRYAVAQVDVFSGPAFFWAEAVCAALTLAGKPFVLTLHGGNLPVFAARWPKRVRRLLASATVVTTPSPYLLEHFQSVRPDMRLLSNGVDLRAYTPRPATGVGPALVCVRAFHRIYNPGLAVRTLARLVPVFPGVHLTMVGADKGDGTRQAVERLATELGVRDRVDIRGAVPKSDVPHVLRSADIFLNTTNVESVGVTTIEAMASGLCVVSTNVGGLPYLVSHERDGLLVPPDDADAMAAAVARLIDDPALAGRISRRAHEKAQAFDWSPIIAEWRSLFETTARQAA